MNAEIQQIAEAETILRERLARAAFVSIGVAEAPPLFGPPGPCNTDFMLPVQAGNDRWRLACKVEGRARRVR